MGDFCQCDFSSSTKDMNFKLYTQIACGAKSMSIHFVLIFIIFLQNTKKSVLINVIFWGLQMA